MTNAAKIDRIKQEGLRHEFKVVVPTAEITKAMDTRLTSYQKKVKMPGFRPGKVPMNIVRQQYSTVALGEAVEDIVNATTQKTLTDNKLRPAVQPKIEGLNLPKEGEDLHYNMSVEVLPTFTPADVTTLAFDKMVATPGDAEVQERLTEIAKRMPRTEPAADGYAAKKGDTTVIDFAGKLNGVARKEMSGERYPLELGSDSFIPGFEEQLIGIKKGEKRTVKLTFPANYGSAEFAGQPAEFDVTVVDVRVAAPAVIDEEFAKMLGLKDVASLTENVKKSLEGELNSISRGKLKRAVMDKLNDAHTFELPKAMVEQEFNGIWQQLQADKARGQLDADDAKKTDKELEKEYRDISERRVRLGLVLAEIGTVQKVKVDQKDLQNALRNEASRYPGQEQRIVEYYTQNGAALQALQASIYEDKVIDKIIELAKITEKTVSTAELRKQAD